ncbi:MAG: GNAT family N-acetyltransferase [Actinomycetota bacterium]|nr:GNAT family N-acetyltransferase [Actinomycetota bacterium]
MPRRAGERLHFRKATLDDGDLLLTWRNDPETIVGSISQRAVTTDEHERWFAAAIRDPSIVLLIASSDRMEVGMVRFEVRSGETWEISVTVAPEHRHKGLGTEMIKAATIDFVNEHPGARVLARVLAANERSRKAFERAGYELLEQDHALLTMGYPPP